MPDKRIEENPQIPKQKQPPAPAGRALDNRDVMSNATETPDPKNTEQVGPRAAYMELNRNGMVNSLDPSGQGLNLRLNEGDTAPVILSAETTRRGKGAPKPKRPSRP